MRPPDLAQIAREFLLEMQSCVRAVDYERARPLFADNVVAFGTFAAVVSGRDRLEHEQWPNVWPTIRDFTFRLDELHCLGSPEAVCVVVPWDSIGTATDGRPFSRPGRATLLLIPRDGRWVAAHSHFRWRRARPRHSGSLAGAMPKSSSTLQQGREVPRPFKFHWGSGQIVEEASFTGTYVEPAIQLLEYDSHPGVYAIRFCYYSLDGRFQRSPMMLDGPDSLG